jgi:hypothetical protein
MKVLICLLIIAPNILLANPLKKGKYDPAVDTPVVPATRVPLEELQKSPNKTPSQNQSEKFRGTLKGKQEYDEDITKKKNKQDKR